jgi:hypothetical protein
MPFSSRASILVDGLTILSDGDCRKLLPGNCAAGLIPLLSA